MKSNTERPSHDSDFTSVKRLMFPFDIEHHGQSVPADVAAHMKVARAEAHGILHHSSAKRFL
jgi:hypothetical protein